jgi:hypothetical protein
VVTYRRISQDELQHACERIDPNTEGLVSYCHALVDNGFTLAMALVKIADEQPASRKPAGSAPAESKFEVKKHTQAT